MGGDGASHRPRRVWTLAKVGGGRMQSWRCSGFCHTSGSGRIERYRWRSEVGGGAGRAQID